MSKKKDKAYLLCVEESQIIEDIDFGSFRLIDTTVGFVFHVKGGYDILVKPRMAALYEHLRFLVDGRHKYELYSDEDKKIYDSVFNATVANLEIPLFMASNDKYLFEIAEKAISCLNQAASEALSAPLQPETPEENGQFERLMDAAAEVEASVKEELDAEQK